MGVSYRAITIIGCEIDLRDLYSTTELYEEDHGCETLQKMLGRGEHPDFCPTCGEELRLTEQDCLVPEFEKCDEDKKTLGGAPVIEALDGRTFLAAYALENDQDGPGGVTFDTGAALDSSRMATRLRAILEPLGMWDEMSFGVYTILDVGH